MGKGKNSDLPEESLTQNPANNLWLKNIWTSKTKMLN
jgi:hypothetical protein